MASGGSNESIVISVPSGHYRENCLNMSRPHSPESFLLDVIRLMFVMTFDAIFVSYELVTQNQIIVTSMVHHLIFCVQDSSQERHASKQQHRQQGR
mmetsp:Transcript_13514/g.23711  ORF Transcript_13514/g.23711 Transcript_13514/m.23711 type:complete len:96 (+) Transcript_13514:307-594(+)